ncbi:MAG: alpha/beta hydrolase [Bacteroidota bacterium]
MDITRRNNITITGNPDAARTMVFGHGFGTDQTSFHELVKHFEKEYRIVLYDNVGGGRSDLEAFTPQRYRDLSGYVSDLIELFEYLDLKEVIYIGHSVNGMVGLLTSISHPSFFHKLILLGASPRYLNDPETLYMGGFNEEDLQGLYEAMSSNYYAWASGFSKMVMANPERPQLAESFAATLSEIRPDVAQFVARAIFESDHRADLPNTFTDILVIQTSNDIAVPQEVGEYLHKHIKNSTYAQVDTHGHFPHISAPNEVAAAIKNYLNPGSGGSV